MSGTQVAKEPKADALLFDVYEMRIRKGGLTEWLGHANQEQRYRDPSSASTTLSWARSLPFQRIGTAKAAKRSDPPVQPSSYLVSPG
jgi:hypothetical protein